MRTLFEHEPSMSVIDLCKHRSIVLFSCGQLAAPTIILHLVFVGAGNCQHVRVYHGDGGVRRATRISLLRPRDTPEG